MNSFKNIEKYLDVWTYYTVDVKAYGSVATIIGWGNGLGEMFPREDKQVG